MANTFIHSASSLKNHTQFQTKMVIVYALFQTKNGAMQHIPIWLTQGSTPTGNIETKICDFNYYI